MESNPSLVHKTSCIIPPRDIRVVHNWWRKLNVIKSHLTEDWLLLMGISLIYLIASSKPTCLPSFRIWIRRKCWESHLLLGSRWDDKFSVGVKWIITKNGDGTYFNYGVLTLAIFCRRNYWISPCNNKFLVFLRIFSHFVIIPVVSIQFNRSCRFHHHFLLNAG